MDHFKPFSHDSNSSPEVAEPQDDSDLDQAPSGEEKQARLQYLKSIAQKPKSSRKTLIVVGLAILALLIVAGAYIYTKPHKTSQPIVKKATTAQVAPTAGDISSTTTHYVSNGKDLNLNFDYPANWSVTPLSGGNTDDQTITLNSPLTTITSAAGGNATGKVTVVIRPASAGLNELSSGKATAAQTSVQFAYTKPTSAQFQYPFLAFIHLAGGTNPTSAFEEVLISGTHQITKGDSITASTITPDPIISGSFFTCVSTTCTGAGTTPLSITNDTWQNEKLFQQTLALFESLQIN